MGSTKETIGMDEKQTCLVLEGGALRGVYTAGVQGVLHRAGIPVHCFMGTSAGAMNAINFLAGQPERSFQIDHHFAPDRNFMGLRPLLRERQIFSFRYMFGTVNDTFPFDEKTYTASPIRLVAVATDCETGQPAYLEACTCSDMMLALQASGSMPLLSYPICLDGRHYLDGGPSMAVAYPRALEEGYHRVVLVLTRQKGYRKSPLSRGTRLAMKLRFRDKPAFYAMMKDSPRRYNAMMDEIDQLEAQGRLFVIRPSQPVTVSRAEKDQKKLEDLFLLGRKDAEACLPALGRFLGLEESMA
jgi:predicted patatin/cPLA2 family phospholipase